MENGRLDGEWKVRRRKEGLEEKRRKRGESVCVGGECVWGGRGESVRVLEEGSVCVCRGLGDGVGGWEEGRECVCV